MNNAEALAQIDAIEARMFARREADAKAPPLEDGEFGPETLLKLQQLLKKEETP